ncbi:hypothetical protein SADUNF_Sadunf09G0126800 [Salix dunnii]|uniref:Uncharacterized protein n=1 Tax=Salix dunnii TaxID=1413687 RepID=A0A835JWJ1_9ROSI|nr:hypothetical protein SADUNF_Sadunf09G0126800 [Salix dunnii]
MSLMTVVFMQAIFPFLLGEDEDHQSNPSKIQFNNIDLIGIVFKRIIGGFFSRKEVTGEQWSGLLARVDASNFVQASNLKKTTEYVILHDRAPDQSRSTSEASLKCFIVSKGTVGPRREILGRLFCSIILASVLLLDTNSLRHAT